MNNNFYRQDTKSMFSDMVNPIANLIYDVDPYKFVDTLPEDADATYVEDVLKHKYAMDDGRIDMSKLTHDVCVNFDETKLFESEREVYDRAKTVYGAMFCKGVTELDDRTYLHELSSDDEKLLSSVADNIRTSAMKSGVDISSMCDSLTVKDLRMELLPGVKYAIHNDSVLHNCMKHDILSLANMYHIRLQEFRNPSRETGITLESVQDRSEFQYT